MVFRAGIGVVAVNSFGKGPVDLVPNGLGCCFWKLSICMEWAETNFSANGGLFSFGAGDLLFSKIVRTQ